MSYKRTQIKTLLNNQDELEICVCIILYSQLYACPYKKKNLKRGITLFFFSNVNQVIKYQSLTNSFNPADQNLYLCKLVMSYLIWIAIYTECHSVFNFWMTPHLNITKTCLYYLDPLKPHFYIVKLGFTGVYIIFLFLLKNIDCGHPLEPPHQGGSNEFPETMFWAEIWKISEFFIWKISFFCGKIFSIFE